MTWRGGIVAACIIGLWPVAAIGAAGQAVSIESSSTQARQLSHEELQALLNRLETNLGGLKTLQVDFVQEKHLSIFTSVVKSEGRILFERPDKVRFEITQPFRSVLITNGEAVARYECESGGWKKLDAGDAPMVLIVTRQISAWLEGRFRDESGTYDISAEAGEPPIIVLTPRDEGLRKYISAIRLRLDSAVARVTSVTICEPSGDYTLMTFADESRNAALPANAFDTTAATPAPADIDKAQGSSDEKSS
jgi:outer membrane lipoprotein-sorting protein